MDFLVTDLQLPWNDAVGYILAMAEMKRLTAQQICHGERFKAPITSANFVNNYHGSELFIHANWSDSRVF